jgi:hypothetical protein
MFDIINIGTDDMNITHFERIYHNGTVGLRGQLPKNPIPSQQTASVTEISTIDTCRGGNFYTQSYIEALPTTDAGADLCKLSAVYTFNQPTTSI